MEQALEEDPVDGDWNGCILVKDNKFYFGSYEKSDYGYLSATAAESTRRKCKIKKEIRNSRRIYNM